MLPTGQDEPALGWDLEPLEPLLLHRAVALRMNTGIDCIMAQMRRAMAARDPHSPGTLSMLLVLSFHLLNLSHRIHLLIVFRKEKPGRRMRRKAPGLRPQGSAFIH